MCCCDNQPEFYDRNIVKGRKVHKCCECLRDIQPGEMQEVASGKWEGGFETFRTCMSCVDLRELLNLECWVHGSLCDECSELWGDFPELVERMDAFRQLMRENWERERLAREN